MTSDVNKLLESLPNVPKFTEVDNLALDKQYAVCVQIIELLYDTFKKNAKCIISDTNVKTINKEIKRFYELSECVIKTKKVLEKIQFIDQFKKIIMVINTQQGMLDFKTFYNTLKSINSPKAMTVKN